MLRLKFIHVSKGLCLSFVGMQRTIKYNYNFILIITF